MQARAWPVPAGHAWATMWHGHALAESHLSGTEHHPVAIPNAYNMKHIFILIVITPYKVEKSQTFWVEGSNPAPSTTIIRSMHLG